MRSICVCLLVAAAVAGAAAAGDFNFFPNNVRASPMGDQAECSTGDCAFPAVWHLSSQTAYPNLGNKDGHGLLKVAVSDYYPLGPTLFIIPGAWCDTAGAGVSTTAEALTPKGAATPTTPATPAAADPASAAADPAASAAATTAPAAPLPRRLLEGAPAAAADAAAPSSGATEAAAVPVDPAADTAPADTAGDAAPADTVEAASPADAATTDAAPTDAAPTDAAPTDAAPTDAATTDAATTDAATTDAATTDAAPTDAATAPTDASAPADTAAAAEPADTSAAAASADGTAPADAAASTDATTPTQPAAAAAPAAPAAPQAPAFVVDADGTCVLTGDFPVTFKVGDGPTLLTEKHQVDGVNVYKVALPPNMADGPVCVTIAATYDTSNVRTTPSYTDSFEPLAPTTTFSKTVCLHKLTRQANAKLDFDMCTNNQFMLNITNITPLPVNLTLDDTPMSENLMRPLVKVWGGKVAELDGTPTVPSNYDEVASRTEYNWIARYIPIASSYAGEPLSYTLSNSLQEGYYEVSAVVSAMTAYPLLTSLSGLTQITQEDASGEGVKGLWEAASRQLHDKTLVGVQKGSTPTTLSEISSSSHAPGQAVLPGQQVVLNWQFRGVGSATCMHDGQPVSNAADGKCVSPLTIEAKDVSAVDTQHFVNVTFSDVCGRSRTADFLYTQSGVRPLTAAEVLKPDGTIQKLVDGGGSSKGGSGVASGSGPGAGGSAMIKEDAAAAAGNGTVKSGAADGAAGRFVMAGAAAVALAALLL